MPTRTYKRLWCKTCNEFELHEPTTLFEKELHCIECSTAYTEVYLSEIPEEKLIAQRKRYTEHEKRGMTNVYQMLMMGVGLHGIGHNIGFGDTEIMESDAAHHYNISYSGIYHNLTGYSKKHKLGKWEYK